jgi:hypothetical protein
VKKHYSEEQIIGFLKEADAGVPFNAQMLAYIGALIRVSSQPASYSLLDVIRSTAYSGGAGQRLQRNAATFMDR